MTPEPPHNPYASPLSDALPDEADPSAAYDQLRHKRHQQATATAASWIAGGLLTCGAYTWFVYEFEPRAAVIVILVLANLIGIGWMVLGIAAACGSERAHGIGLIWSYLAAAFFLTHCNLLAALVVALIITQGHRLKSFDRQLLEMSLALKE
jgi:hypothetical protein